MTTLGNKQTKFRKAYVPQSALGLACTGPT